MPDHHPRRLPIHVLDKYVGVPAAPQLTAWARSCACASHVLRRRSVQEGTEEAQRTPQPPQADPQLMGSFGIVGFQHYRPIGEDLLRSRPHHRRQRLTAGGIVRKDHFLGVPRKRSVHGAAGRQVVSTVGFVPIGEPYLLIAE